VELFMTVTDVTVPASSVGGLRLLRSLRRDPLRLLGGLNRDQGPLVRLRVPGVPVYLLSDPEAIREALTHTHRGYEKGLARRGDPAGPGTQPLARILGQGLLTSPAPLHRRQRRLIQPMFHRARIAGYADTFVELTTDAVRDWSPEQVRDVHRDLTELTLAVIARTVFDVDLDSAVVDSVRRAVAQQAALRRVGPYGRLLDRLPVPSTRRWRAASKDLDAVVYRLIADRRRRNDRSTELSDVDSSGRSDVLSLLLEARDADTGEVMSDVQIRDEAMTLLLAGHETTANALAWALHLLALDQPAQDRMREEVLTVLGDRAPTLADVPKLGRTAGVWQETLRLYPPAWMVGRRLVEDRSVCGFPLRAGSMLVMSPWVVHRDPQWWPEPDAFRPDRWGTDDRARYTYFPFGGGPRQCIGNDFAELEGILMLATIVRDRQFRPAPGAPAPVPQPQVTLRPRGGLPLLVRPVPRPDRRLSA
jgi:cytochrome P450